MSNSSCGENKVTKEKDPCRKSVCISDSCWIERPRFFNGQLLTDADLKAEQNYVIEKNKLHNRYLHGWGVVSGLKVKCYPCCEGYGSSGKVLIEPGYAIDCCGNDIVVCEEQEFDVVKRISQMKQKQKEESSPCGSATSVQEPSTANIEEKYYLTLTYKEEEAKPATALRADDPCSIQRCVPSRTKECFELDLVKFCTLEPTPDDDFLTRIKKCIEIFSKTWEIATGDKEFSWDKLKILKTEELKKFIREYYKALPSKVHCDVLDQLDGVEVSTDNGLKYLFEGECSTWMLPDSAVPINVNEIIRYAFLQHQKIKLGPSAAISKISQTDWKIQDGDTFYIIKRNCKPALTGAVEECTCTVFKQEEVVGKSTYLLIELLIDCICQALLIPCPTCNEDDVVILATITVKSNKIDKICNLARKYVLTSHSFNYWITPYLNLWVQGLFKTVSTNGFKIESIHDWLDFLCCNLDFPDRQNQSYFKKLRTDFGTPIMMGQNFSEFLSTISKNFMDTLDPQNVSLNSALNKKTQESADLLKNLGFEVVGKAKFDPAARDLSLDDIFRIGPMARPGSRVTQLVDDNDNVVGFRVEKAVKVEEKAKEESAGATEDVKVLKKLMAEMSKKMEAMETELQEIKNKPEETKPTRTKPK